MFRAWDSHYKEMRYSDRHDGEFYVNTKGILYMYKIPNSDKYYKTYKVDRLVATYGERKLYEGDIVRDDNCSDYVYVVKYLKQECKYYAVGVTETQKENSLGYKINPRLKVIGNIYENPELLVKN